MKSSFIRTSVVTGVTAAAAIAVTACSPQLENPSDEKVETATEFSYPPGGEPAGPTAPADATTTTGATTAAAATAANGVVEPGAPSFIDCVAPPVQTPETVSLNCADNSDTLTEIDWEQWGTEEASGTGTRETTDPATGETSTEENVDVTLAAPIEGAQGPVFTEITVDGQVVTP